MGAWILILCALSATAAELPNNQDHETKAAGNENSGVAKSSSRAVERPSADKPGDGKPQTVPLHEHPTLLQMLAENNRLRAGLGIPPHEISPELTKAAQDHAWYMARTGNFSHYSNGGPQGRATRHGFHALASENIAMGHTSVRDVFRGWRASPGHWSNIISRSTTKAGFGYGISPSGERYWVAMYGN